jgi:hypothetical protein
MKKEYDFSKAEQGRFYRPLVELDVPVYLERKVRMALAKPPTRRSEASHPSSTACFGTISRLPSRWRSASSRHGYRKLNCRYEKKK